MPDDKQVSVSIRMSEELHETLKHHANEMGTTLTAYVSWTLERFHGYLHARFMHAAAEVKPDTLEG